MFILSQDFAVDPYHKKCVSMVDVRRRSSFAVQFKAYLHTKDKPEMDIVWNIYRYELHTVYAGRRRKVSACPSRTSKLYVV